jgi:serine protease
LQADGAIVAVGTTYAGTSLNGTVARFGADGKLDSTFGTDGTLTRSDFLAESVALQPDGKILVAGTKVVGASTMAIARYQVGLGLATGVPTRVLETRGGPKPKAGSTTRVRADVPVGTPSVLVNLTVTGAEAAGYVSADACSTLNPAAQSNLNYQAGADIANTALVSLDADGYFCVYTSQSVHLLADLAGSYGPAGQRLLSRNPIRVLNTRTDAKAAANSITRVATGAPAGTTAVLVNLTVTGAATAGFITADKCSTLVPGPQSKSNANYVAGVDIANGAVVNIDLDGSFCIYSSAAVHEIVDLQGTYQPGIGDNLTKPAPARVLNTRSGTKPKGNTITRVTTGVPAGATAVLVNLTVTGAEAAGYITADKCSALSVGPQPKSNANYQAGIDIANTAVVNVDTDGSFCIYSDQSAHLIVDLQGMY